MSAEKVTPGPWFVGSQNDALFIIDRRPAHSNDYPNHKADTACIAKVYEAVRGSETAGRANARLIAAAPELLGALADIYRELAWDQLPPHKRSLADNARATIAKATGSTACTTHCKRYEDGDGGICGSECKAIGSAT